MQLPVHYERRGWSESSRSPGTRSCRCSTPALDADIDLLHVRQEAAAVHMADAWGRLTGEPGVALVTAGPGFANTLTGLYVATISESPLVLLSGCAPMNQHAKGAFQAMAQAEIASHVSKASWTAESASGLPNDIRRALGHRRVRASGAGTHCPTLQHRRRGGRLA